MKVQDDDMQINDENTLRQLHVLQEQVKIFIILNK